MAMYRYIIEVCQLKGDNIHLTAVLRVLPPPWIPTVFVQLLGLPRPVAQLARGRTIDNNRYCAAAPYMSAADVDAKRPKCQPKTRCARSSISPLRSGCVGTSRWPARPALR